MKKQLLILIISLLLLNQKAKAQCNFSTQDSVSLILTTDGYAIAETSWTFKDRFGTTLYSNPQLFANSTSLETFCVPKNTCIYFQLNDTYGDGMCCPSSGSSVVPGFTLSVNGNTIAVVGGNDFRNTYITSFGCPLGGSCATAITATTGTYTAPSGESWYQFTPSQPGTYEVTTCNLNNTCDTKIWGYESCSSILTTNNTGTTFYNDDFCGQLSKVSVAMNPSKTYYIRVGGDVACNTSPIEFSITYSGPITGCTNNTACNYDPLATVDNGSCLFAPNPLCGGPDLTVDQPAMQNSLVLGQVNADLDVCAVNEGCLNGFGMRTVIRFDTYIKNIGTEDYYIGTATSQPGQFTYDNCHNHNHYQGYAEYILFDKNSTKIPIGVKNGFCVLDYDGCPGGGIAKYGCTNMGITAGCGDIYSAALECQWIDITDVDTGAYTLALRVNWDKSADALGKHETNYDNNWAQSCIRITKDISGNKNYVVLPNCQPYTDCLGVQYGDAQPDCNGTCAGTAKMGDLIINGQQQLNDVQEYVNKIVNNTISPTNCNDLNKSNSITVWDAALLLNCAKHGASFNNRCNFPKASVPNPNHTAIFSVGNFQPAQNYFDVYVTNPTTRILGYEFTISGATIAGVSSLTGANYPANPEYVVGGNKIACLSYQDSTIAKSITAQPLCRVFYSSVTANNICIDNLIEVVNKDYEAIYKAYINNCILNVGTEELLSQNNYFLVVPNPAQDNVQILCNYKEADNATVEIRDILGRLVYEQKASLSKESNLKLDVSSYNNGLYYVIVKTNTIKETKPLIISR